jgi:hypothetical protein
VPARSLGAPWFVRHATCFTMPRVASAPGALIEEILSNFDEVGIDPTELEEVQHGKQQYRLLRSTVSYTIGPPTGTLVGPQVSKEPNAIFYRLIGSHASILMVSLHRINVELLFDLVI